MPLERTREQKLAERFDDLEVHAARFVAVVQEAQVCDGLFVGGRVVLFATPDLVATTVQQAEVECRDACARHTTLTSRFP
mgnify:CR=1 FL=1